MEITRRRQYIHPSLTCLHKHTQPEGLSCISTVFLESGRQQQLAGFLLRINTGLLLLVFVHASSPLLFYPSLSSVHLLFICSGVLVQYILNHLCPQSIITNSWIFSARSSSACRPQQFLLSNIIHQAHLRAGRTDLMKACAQQRKIYVPALHVRLEMIPGYKEI